MKQKLAHEDARPHVGAPSEFLHEPRSARNPKVGQGRVATSIIAPADSAPVRVRWWPPVGSSWEVAGRVYAAWATFWSRQLQGMSSWMRLAGWSGRRMTAALLPSGDHRRGDGVDLRCAGSRRRSPRSSSGAWVATRTPSSKIRIALARTWTSSARRRVVSGTLQRLPPMLTMPSWEARRSSRRTASYRASGSCFKTAFSSAKACWRHDASSHGPVDLRPC